MRDRSFLLAGPEVAGAGLCLGCRIFVLALFQFLGLVILGDAAHRSGRY